MEAVVIDRYGSVEELKYRQLPKPTPSQLGPLDLLIRVKATGMNPVDYKVRSNFGKTDDLPKRTPLILGYDGAGIVEAIGSGVTRFQVNDAVYWSGDFTKQGSNAQYQIVDSRIVGHKPHTLSMEQAAAVPLVYLTAYELLVESMRIPFKQNMAQEKSILIIGAAGGVGSIAIQIAKKILGLRVIATASRPESREWCMKMSADHVINHKEDLKSQITAIWNELCEKTGENSNQALSVKNGNVNYVMILTDPKQYLKRILPLVSPLVDIGMVSSLEWSDPLPIADFMSKRASFHWSFIFSRPLYDWEPETHGQLLDQAAKWFDNGTLQPYLSKILQWEEIPEAHKIQEGGSVVGKLVVNVP